MLSRAGFSQSRRETLWTVFDLLTDESLAASPEAGKPRFSGICRDGSPWQFCAVLGAPNPAPVRFLTEAGRWGDTLAQRNVLGVARIPQALRAAGHADCGPEISRLAEAVPKDTEHFAGLWIGVAAGPSMAPRFRAYANIGWGTVEERWLRLIGLLGDFAAQGLAGKINVALPQLLESFQPAGFALTLPSRPTHVKFYFRPFAPPWASLGALMRCICEEAAEDIAARLEAAFGMRLSQLPWRSLVLSLSGPADGSSWDMKLDFCGHCLFRNGVEAVFTVERLAAAFGFSSVPCHEMLEDMGVPAAELSPDAVAFIGVGANRAGADRINVYFSPDAVSWPDAISGRGHGARHFAL
jgi:hypothetical protein